MSAAEDVLELAFEAGFDLAGLAPFAPAPGAERYGAWLDAGHQGTMAWMERARAAVESPITWAPEGRTLLVVGVGHSRPAGTTEDGGRIARYAMGADYHNWVGRRLRKLAKRLAEAGLVKGARSAVDAVPLFERAHASAAGIGFESKAANLLHPKFGPWFFLGELVLDVELDPTVEAKSAPPLYGDCGTCTACLDACPTDAFDGPGVLDARRCLSYVTIEHKGLSDPDLREKQGDWAFGCDICSEVCPWGNKAPDHTDRFGTHSALEGARLTDWVTGPADPDAFREHFLGSPVRRAGREGLAANSAVVLGHRPTDEGLAALRHALERDPSSQVRESAAWSLAFAHGADDGTRPAIERAMAREDDVIAAAMRASLERY
tara:strand:- start:66 stop:1196 length:1131 start_codon:yes stop_codon:yes gene_type:complete